MCCSAIDVVICGGVKGMANNQIADHLTVSMATTKSHISNILAKLGLQSRPEIIALAVEHNFNMGAFYIK